MLGGKNRQPLGYTIIEVMIVLAVSGVMFLIAATFINGKQARTAFTAGVNEMASQIQDVINQVQSGKYSDIQLNCQGAAGGSISFPPGTTQQQGQNPACVFLGKVIHFSVAGNKSSYEIISVAGNRLDSSGNPSTDPVSAGARFIPGLTTQGTIAQSLEINHDIFSGSYAIAFLQSQGSSTVKNSQTTLLTGAQTIQLYYVSGIGASDDENTAEKAIQNTLLPLASADICLSDGSRYAEILIGAQQNQQAVTVKMDGTTAC